MIPKDHFNSIAHLYDSFKNRNPLYYNTLKKAIKKEITIKRPKILDIGCGTGTILNYLNPVNGVGIDISDNMIELAHSKLHLNSHLIFKVHNIEKSPLKGMFDYILFNDVIEHVIDKGVTIKNIAKSMNKNTTLILSMANPIWEPLLIIMEKLNLKMPEGPHLRISEKELIFYLNKHHLSIYRKTVYLPKINLPIIENLGLILIYVIKKNFY